MILKYAISKVWTAPATSVKKLYWLCGKYGKYRKVYKKISHVQFALLQNNN